MENPGRQSSVPQMPLPAVFVVAFSLLVACGLLPVPMTVDRSRPIRVEAVTLTDDRRSGRIDFVGAAEFDPNDRCTASYVADVEVVDDELRVAVYALIHPGALQRGLICELIGYPRKLTFSLSQPFTGNRVRDLAGQLFFLEAPEGLVEITGLPEGWALVEAESLISSPTGRWSRVFAPVDDPTHPTSSIQLIQAFGVPASVGGGETVSHHVVNHEQATLFLHEPSGELVMVWEVAGDGVALVGNLHEFSLDEFLRLAESIVPAGDLSTSDVGMEELARTVRIDSVTIAPDGLSARIEFIGGAEFDPSDPCSVAYVAHAEVVGEQLRLRVLRQGHPLSIPASTACLLMGYPRTLVVTLDRPFLGTLVVDQAAWPLPPAS